MLVSGEEAVPDSTDLDGVQDWKLRGQKAAGALFLALEHEQRVHLGGIESDPIAIWSKLESVHLAQRPGARFNAYDGLFSIRKRPDESLQALMNRVDESLRSIVNLRPKTFLLKDLDDELACMALIRSLPEEYSHFTSSLLLLDTLDKNKLQSAFMTEELNRTRRPDLLSSQDSASALKAQSSSIRPAGTQQRRPRNALHCDYCGKDGHVSNRCFRRMEKLLGDSGPSSQANAASSSSSQVRRQEDRLTSSSGAEEFAGSASLRSSSSCTPSQLPADLLWCADTGATAHMTPHLHWFRSYRPHRVPV